MEHEIRSVIKIAKEAADNSGKIKALNAIILPRLSNVANYCAERDEEIGSLTKALKIERERIQELNAELKKLKRLKGK